MARSVEIQLRANASPNIRCGKLISPCTVFRCLWSSFACSRLHFSLSPSFGWKIKCWLRLGLIHIGCTYHRLSNQLSLFCFRFNTINWRRGSPISKIIGLSHNMNDTGKFKLQISQRLMLFKETRLFLYRVIKLILLEFVNNFLSLFYIAFWLGDVKMISNQLMTQLIVFQVTPKPLKLK